MKSILLIFSFLLAGYCARAQATLEHTYDTAWQYQVILFSASGEKFMVTQDADSVFYFYNTDYSLWKIFRLPTIPQFQLFGFGAVSDHLFNLDDSVEILVFYYDITHYRWLTTVVNENSRVIQYVDSSGDGAVHYIDGHYKLITQTIERSDSASGYRALNCSMSVYMLPGSLPCGICGTMGVESPHHSAGSSFASAMVVPNPSKDEAKIYYTLPPGVQLGAISIYSTTGQLVKTYSVTNAFPYITLDNSKLSPGVYYYNLTGNGNVFTGNKMIIIK